MRVLIAIAFGCVLALGVNQAASPDALERGAQPAAERSSPAAEDTTQELQLDHESSYQCKYSPYCQQASQCTAYCSGGVPVCVQGCCSCAS